MSGHHHHHHRRHSTAGAVAEGVGRALLYTAVAAVEVAAEHQREREHAADHRRMEEHARAQGYMQAQYDAQRREAEAQRRAAEAERAAAYATERTAKMGEADSLITDASRVIYATGGKLQTLKEVIGLSDDLNTAREKLRQAEVIASSYSYTTGLGQIKQLQQRLRWLDAKQLFMEAYTEVTKQIAAQSVDRHFIFKVEGLINQFKRENLYPTAEESSMLDKLKEILVQARALQQRVEDRARNKLAETKIISLMAEANAARRLGDFRKAHATLLDAKRQADSINYLEDIANRQFKQTDFFNDSLAILSTRADEFERRKKSYAFEYARKLVDQAIEVYAFAGAKTLLRRHYERLVDGMARAFAAHWAKFDLKPDAEFAELFKQITQMIHDAIIPADWKTTVGSAKQNGLFSMDRATLKLAEPHNKTLTPNIVAAISTYVPATQPQQIFVPLFDTEAPTEELPYFPPVPSAPPMIMAAVAVSNAHTTDLCGSVPLAVAVEDEDKSAAPSAALLG